MPHVTIFSYIKNKLYFNEMMLTMYTMSKCLVGF